MIEPATANATTEAALEGWIDWLARRGLSPTTTIIYIPVVTRFARTHDDWTAATTDDVERWCHRPRPRAPIPAPSTIQQSMAALRSFYGWARRMGYTDRDPTDGAITPKVRNINPRPPDDNVWVDMWANNGVIAHAGLGLGYYVGLRRAEILALRWDHLDVERRRLVGFTRKGGGDDVIDYGECVEVIAERLPHLLPDADVFFDALKEQHERAQETTRGLILPSLGGERWFYRAVQRWQTNAGHLGAFTPHALRHGFVSNLLRCDVPIHIVSRLANHTSIDTTMRYVKTSQSELRAWRLRTPVAE